MADRGPNTVGKPGGIYQDLDTGLHYDSVTNEVVEQKDNTGLEVLQEDQIGVFRRIVHTDGSVATFQNLPADNPTEIKTPVPLPGEKQDQAGTGQVDDVKSGVKASKSK